LRQERRVHVERTQARHVEQLLRKNASVRSQHEQIETFAGDRRGELAKLQRLVYAHAELERARLHRRRRKLMTAAGGTIRLRDDACELRARGRHSQTRNGKGARSEEERLHSDAVSAISF